MDDFDTSFLDDTDEVQEQEIGKFREQTVIMIDAHPKMLETCDLPDPELNGLSWLGAVLKVAAAMLRSKVVAGAEDETALVFYNTRTTRTSQDGLESVYVLQKLDRPDVHRIKELESLAAEEFEELVGKGICAPEDRTRALAQGLWEASAILPPPRGRATGTTAVQRVMVCTRDMAPAPSLDAGSSVAVRARAIAAGGGAVQLLPLVGPRDSPFALSPFWEALLREATPRVPEGEPALGSAAQGGELDEERILHVSDLVGVVRARAYRKRAVNRLKWHLAPAVDGASAAPTIAVRLYSLLHTAWPSCKGGAVWLDAVDNAPLKSRTALVDSQTGAIVSAPRLFYPKPDERKTSTKFPRVYVTAEEVRQLKSPLPKGLTLLGFKPRASLEGWHQLRAPTFVNPDEPAAAGSTHAFVALHDAMLRSNRIALCLLVKSPIATPVLVAALPQVEEVGEYGGQLSGPGFHLIYLPFADEVRAPEEDPAFTGVHRAVPTEAQVAAAEALLSELQLEDFDPAAVPNPHLQRHFEVLECVALGEEPAAEPRDETLPDAAAFERSAGVIAAFKAAAYGEGYGADVAAAQGAKRKAPQADPADAAALAAEVERMDFAAQANKGTLMKLTAADMKKYLRVHKLPLGGVKAELQARIEAHLAKEGKL